MNAILTALADVIASSGWFIIPLALIGLGDVVGRWADGRKKIGRLKTENKALKSRIQSDAERGDAQAQSLAALGITADPRHERLLWRVQAADEALRQLPTDLRHDIDTVLATARPMVERRQLSTTYPEFGSVEVQVFDKEKR